MTGLVSPAPSEPAPTGWWASLIAFGELRDTIVFGFSTLYVLGYVTWAIYSADRGLGVLPPLEGQYFLAGVVPLFLLTVAYLFIRTLRPAENATQRRRAAQSANVMFIAGVLILGAYYSDALSEPYTGFLMPLQNILLFGGMWQLIRSGDSQAIWMRWVLAVAVPLIVVVAAGLWYATRIFPAVPGEFGGPQPSCVTLDLAASSLSRDTAAALGVVPQDATAAARSAPVWLHFSGGGLLVVSRAQGRPVPGVVRLQDSTVSAFTPAQGCK